MVSLGRAKEQCSRVRCLLASGEQATSVLHADTMLRRRCLHPVLHAALELCRP